MHVLLFFLPRFLGSSIGFGGGLEVHLTGSFLYGARSIRSTNQCIINNMGSGERFASEVHDFNLSKFLLEAQNYWYSQ